MPSKPFHSDPGRKRLVCSQTCRLIITLRKLGLEFEAPIREILTPLSTDGVMMDKFIEAFVRIDDDE